jgi:1,4-alpha-glucan branching enzyme
MDLLLVRWVTEYRIDGFQFHSLSSMLYTHNGFSTFTGAIEEYVLSTVYH